MSWRAFAIGILGVVGLCLLTPVNDYAFGNTFLTGNHFPVGPFFFLTLLTVCVNLAIRLVRPAWMLRQAELMLVWCMLLVASSVPASGLVRYWLPMSAAAPYLSQRADLFWEDDVLKFAFSTFGIQVSGQMSVEEDKVVMNCELPFSAMMFKGKIVGGIQEALEKVLA